MKSAVYFPPEYFLKYKDKPVKLKPYNIKQGKIGDKYLKLLKTLLKEFNADIWVRGSTAYKISGKGDVEIGVYPERGGWGRVVRTIKEKFGDPETIEKNYIRFNLLDGVTEVEFILLKGREAVVDKALHNYMLSHPELLKEYEEIKKKYSYSKRDYNFRKNKFLRNVEKNIPES